MTPKKLDVWNQNKSSTTCQSKVLISSIYFKTEQVYLVIEIALKNNTTAHVFECDIDNGKGQLISKCPFGVIIWTKIPTKKFNKFLPQNLKSGEINKIKALSYNTIIYI